MSLAITTSQPRPISADVPDWAREQSQRRWDPSRRLLNCIRRYQQWNAHGGFLGRQLAKFFVLAHRFWSVVTGADIPLNTRIGGGLLLPHPNGVVIHPQAEVGPNCLIFQQVTIGTGGKIPGVPQIGGHVDIGAGARILGGVVIGDHARIGANAVVLEDVAPGATAVGIPAVTVRRREEALR
jgi:serine O-acetyltransferase